MEQRPRPLLVTENPHRRAREAALERALDRWFPPREVSRAAEAVHAWDGYRPEPPFELDGLAREVGLGSIVYQDEGRRFGFESFKGWGGGYATAALIEREGKTEEPRPVTVTCATDGNHGRAVAWAARRFGGRAVVFIADIVTDARAELIESYGAEIVRSSGNHEVASAECLAAAEAHGWFVITETENATDPRIALDTLAGYAALWEETLAACSPPPTHLFVQAGVGGLAATAAAVTRRRFGDARPILTVVEAQTADCIRVGLESGRRVTLEGEFETTLAGLAAGATSTFAWELLSAGADFAIAIPDSAAEATMRRLASPPAPDAVIEAGSSGVAGLAGALAVSEVPALRERFGLGRSSRVLVIGTEGPTDREGYQRIVGRAPTTAT